MIGTIKIQLNAAHPNLALQPLYAFVGSPSNLRIIDVPKKIGNWQITEVYVSYNYPDNTQQTLPCTLVGGAYVCTLPASSAVGTSGLGYSVIANGVDENENPVNGYVLGKGDIVILDSEAAINVGAKASYVNLLSAQREVPEDGDMWQTADGGYVIWQDGEVHELNVPFEAISAYVESQVSSKADEDELTAYATIDSLSVYASEEWVESQIGDVMNQLDAKANEDEVNAELAVKADKDYVDAINSEITIRIDNVVNNVSEKAYRSELTAYATTSDLSSQCQLSPMRGGNGEVLSEWSITPPTYTNQDGEEKPVDFEYDSKNGDWHLVVDSRWPAGDYGVVAPEDATSIAFEFDGITYVGTRVENPIVGYTLGTQDDKPLQPKGNYVSAGSLSSYYTKSETSSAAEISNTLAEYVTSAQVTPFSYGFYQGYAEKSYYSGHLRGYSSQGLTLPPNSLLLFSFIGGTPTIQSNIYAPWTLTKWDGADLAEPATLNFNYYGNIIIKKGNRTMQVYVNSYAWVGGIGTSAAYIIKAEDDGGRFQPTGIAKQSGVGTPTYLDLTLTTGGKSIATVDGQEGLVECTRTTSIPSVLIRHFMYDDEISAQLSTKADVAVESDVAQLSSSTSSLSTDVSAVSADVDTLKTAFSQPAKMTYMITPDCDPITGEKFVPLSQATQHMANGVAFFEVEAFDSAFTLQDDMFDRQVTFYYEQQGSYGTLTIPSGHQRPMFRITMIDAMVGSASTPDARFALVEYIGEGNL